MPRTSERGQVLHAIETAVESTAFVYLVESSSEVDELEEDIEDLLIIQDGIDTFESTRHHGNDSLEAYIHYYPLLHCSVCTIHHFGSLFNYSLKQLKMTTTSLLGEGQCGTWTCGTGLAGRFYLKQS